MFLTKEIAKEIVDYYEYKECPTKAELNACIDAHVYLAEICKEYDNYRWIGGYYYEIQRYDLALKYYLLGDAKDVYDCTSGLGYIYYYGRTGKVDYKKALYYFQRAYRSGNNNECGIKIADMYHNGYGVSKDNKKYKDILFKIYAKYKVIKYVQDPIPELATRLGQIYLDKKEIIKAKNIIFKGLSVIEQRLRFNTFWGNLIIAKRLIHLYHQIVPLNPMHLTFIDLFEFFKEENVAVLRYNNRKYYIESFKENDVIRVKCDNVIYKSVENFYGACVLDGHHINVIEATMPFVLMSLDAESKLIKGNKK